MHPVVLWYIRRSLKQHVMSVGWAGRWFSAHFSRNLLFHCFLLQQTERDILNWPFSSPDYMEKFYFPIFLFWSCLSCHLVFLWHHQQIRWKSLKINKRKIKNDLSFDSNGNSEVAPVYMEDGLFARHWGSYLFSRTGLIAATAAPPRNNKTVYLLTSKEKSLLFSELIGGLKEEKVQ